MCRKLISTALAAALCVGLAAPSLAAGGYNDFDAITSHVNLKVPARLTLTRPSDDVSTSAAAYFITGGSDPDQKLTMNGEAVSGRGARGSFGVLVALQKGVNTFVFRNGGRSEEINITRGADTPVTITNIRSAVPSFDCATYSGETISLQCTAPSGAQVTATVGGRQVALKQAAATAVAGVPATFSAKTTAGEVDGTRNLGPVTYTMTYKGKTSSVKSAGSVYLTGSGSRLYVEVKNVAASVYKDAAASAFIETAKGGAVDYVTEVGNMYRLSTGGWIPKESVQPLEDQVNIRSKVSGVSFEQTGSGEYYTFHGTANTMFRAYMDSEKLYVKLFNTTGVVDHADGMADGSELFDAVGVTEEDGDTVMQFMRSGSRRLWGYDISYDDGDVILYAKYAPRVSGGSQPLSGVTIAVDAGHGGADPGAIGIPGTGGAMEKDITLASAVAVQKRLESLGAKVVLCRTGDDDVDMNQRMQITLENRADLFISLHCNSLAYTKDMNTIGGTEVYYFEPISKSLASTLSANVAGYTGRTNRGAKQSNYRVTLNAFAPSVLVEMGFVTNPAEYDSMTSRSGIYQTANAIGDGVLAVLGV